MGVKRTRKEQDFLEERIHIVWTASPSFLLHVNEQETCIVIQRSDFWQYILV
ncbi:hypothetical protein NC651_029164 [Populus alba x Populus x berolinensis]|nr:hypothetical protein NC651_029164 [Populus alba x Populus x berolinensis]